MRRPDVLTPAWWGLQVVAAAIGGVVYAGLSMLFDDQPFIWAQAIFFGTFLLVVDVGLELWRRRQRTRQPLS